MNKVKYQIFISSTYDDLKEERDQVIKACLEMGHIPVGMEMFSAANEEQWQIITRQIDESDYYVIIVASRYGSMVDGISYTEKEYDYAVSKGIPTLGFVLDSKAAWPSNRAETDKKAQVKLEAFKKKVKSKPVNFWATKDDLHGKCAVALMKTFNTQPRPGWVRSPEAIGPEVASELSRLSSENAKLREENDELRKSDDTSGFAQGEDEVVVRFIAYFHIGSHRIIKITTTWNSIIQMVAKFILKDPHEKAIKQAIINKHKEEVLKIAFQFEDSVDSFETYVRLSAVKLSGKDFEIIRTQLLALGLIQIGLNGVSNVWTLTSQGQKNLVSILAKRRTIE